MDLPFEMDSSTLSGSISDQPSSTHIHDGLMVFAALDSSTTVYEIPPLKAGTSKSESSKKLPLSFRDGSDKNHSPSSDAHDENQDLLSNSGSGEVYQPSSTPSSSDNETLSKKKKSSRHRIPEKDHCHRSMNQLKDGEERHSITRKSPADRHKKGVTTKHDDYDADDESKHAVEGQQQTTRRPKAKRQKMATKHDDDDDWSDERDGKEQPMMNTSTPVNLSTKQKHDEDSDEKIQVKRPWTDREKNAVQRQMAKFIVLRKVPRKNACLLCIGKESPVLHTRTWKDIKYFVYNEIKKLKRKLEREKFNQR